MSETVITVENIDNFSSLLVQALYYNIITKFKQGRKRERERDQTDKNWQSIPLLK